jgi:hypothetical protein
MNETEAARAVLIEVLNALGAMRDELVIVGAAELFKLIDAL